MFIHIWLLLVLPFSSVMQLGAVTVRYAGVDDGYGGITYIDYEDWNDNQQLDPEEKSWQQDGGTDTDGDGISDNREGAWGSSPTNPDSDYDGITDGDEINTLGNLGYLPTSWDSDSDGYSDRDEFYGCYSVNYSVSGAGINYYDWDGDGYFNPVDSHPLDNGLYSDWDFNGYNDGNNGPPSDPGPNDPPADPDTDSDGVRDIDDSHPNDPALWTDLDGDGYNAANDSHPADSSRWDDWDRDGDGHLDQNDSDPLNASLWSDWDHDQHQENNDTHPADPNLWADWNGDGYNDGSEPPTGGGGGGDTGNPPNDSDSDGYFEPNDSHPYDSNLWSDWDNDGHNAEQDSNANDSSIWSDYDYDGVNAEADSHPDNNALWSDYDGDGYNAEYDSDPYDAGLVSDWDHDGQNQENDSHPNDPALWSDTDGDGFNAADDTHPEDPALWNDHNGDGANDVPPPVDSDWDGHPDDADSHPNNPSVWDDWNNNGISDTWEAQDSDGDGRPNGSESHPGDPSLWSDWNNDGYNDGTEPPIDTPPSDSDGDGYADSYDSHPNFAGLWNDFNPVNGINDEVEPDNDHDGRIDAFDSDPLDPLLWDDFTPRNGINDPLDILDYDNDGHQNGWDSNPWNALLWSDWNHNGANDFLETEDDLDGDLYPNNNDSDPEDAAFHADWDHDRLEEDVELSIGTDPYAPDTDSDGLLDRDEHLVHHTNPLNPDTDGDLLTDFEELRITPLSNPLDKWSRSKLLGLTTYLTDYQLSGHETDTDHDGIPDPVELAYSLDPNDSSDALGDLDADQITNADEYTAGTSLWGNNYIYDSDDDGMTDLQEDLFNLWYPGVLSRHRNADATEDADGDGLLNYEEIQLGLNPADANSATPAIEVHSGGGVSPDMAYVIANVHPAWAMPVAEGDTDGDGMPDAWEHRYRVKGGLPGLDLRNGADWDLDPDEDTLINRMEFLSDRFPLFNDYEPPPVTSGPYNPGGSVTQPYTQPAVNPLSPGTAGSFNVNHIVYVDSENGSGGPIIEVRYKEWPNGAAMGEYPEWQQGDSVSTSAKTIPQPSGCAPAGAEPTGAGQTCSCKYHNTTNRFFSSGGQTGGGELVQVAGQDTPNYPDDDSWEWQGAAETGWAWTPDPEVICDPGDYTPEDPNPSIPQHLGFASMRMRVLGNVGQPITQRVRVTTVVDGTETYVVIKTMTIPTGESESNSIDESPFGSSKVTHVTIELVGDDSPDDPTQLHISASDSAGPRYRKVGLNGVPMPDAKPQVQNENGEHNEETYIDSYLAQLRHSVSDVYVTEDSSLLPLQVRRDVSPDTWSDRSGLRAWERPFQPFGPGWGSNVCSYIQFSISSGSISADVVDETGNHQNYDFAQIWGENKWLHSQQEHQDIKSVQNEFDAEISAGNPELVTFSNIQLSKKFGTTCFYESVTGPQLEQIFSSDRVYGSNSVQYVRYARLTRVRDRWGNELVYDYPDAKSLIPSVIRDPNRPGHQVTIKQQDGRIVQVRSPNGDDVVYNYADLAVQYRLTPMHTEMHALKVLQSVVRGGNTVSYEPVLTTENEYDMIGRFACHYHVELGKITDERGHEYSFTHVPNASVFYSGSAGRKRQFGLPLKLTSVTSPVIGTMQIVNDRVVDPETAHDYSYQQAAKPVTTTFTYGAGPLERTYTYRFTDAIGTTVLGPVAKYNEGSHTICYSFTNMEIEAPDGGKESYSFNPDANMALASVTDRNGNTTNFFYTNKITSPNVWVPETGRFYDDPTREVNALGQAKIFTYDAATRILKSVTDSRNVKTEYVIDLPKPAGGPFGRRLVEKVSGMVGGKSESLTYGHSQFAGFVTRRTLESLPTNDANKPTKEICPPLVTEYSLPAGATAPGWWRRITETQTVDGQACATLTVSDLNGNKRSVTDGRGYTTTFSYDASNRLTGVHFADGSSKSMAYDAHGNLVKEIDETGRTAFHAYDALNRRISTTVDLNGNNVPDLRGAGDLVDETTYNDLNLPVTKTDARGIVTRYAYDAIGRPARITVNDTAENEADRQVTLTEYKVPGLNGGYEAGSSVFDTSGFKPVRVTDPAGRVTTVKYDKLYRAVEQSGTDAGTVFTTYGLKDSSANPASVSHPVTSNIKTTFIYDAQGRLITTTHPGGKTVKTYYTHHGKPWKTVNEQEQVTITRYDKAGRVREVESPPVAGVSSIVKTGYDLAGNAIEVQDALGKTTKTDYDRRNRAVFVTFPEVVDSKDAELALKQPVVETRYDGAGRVTVTKDPLGYETKKVYDKAGRVISTEDAMGNVTSMTYDEGGNVLTTTNAEGQTVTNHYDGFNRLVETIDHQAISNQFEYDKAGNRTKVTDGRNKVTTFTYDGRNRLKTQVFKGSLTASGTAAQDTWTYNYNAAVKLSETDPAGNVTTFTYDDRDRLKTVSTPALGSVAANVRTFEYDDCGRILSVTESSNAQASVEYVYDALGRITRETSRGISHDYEYDKNGNRTVASYGDGRRTETAYDALNRPVTISEGPALGFENQKKATHYGYDLAGRALQLIAGNGQITRNTYDGLGRLIARVLHQGAPFTDANRQARFNWVHDDIGNVTQQTEQWFGAEPRTRVTVLDYDGTNRLLSEEISETGAQTVTTVYGYDHGNNRTTKEVTATGSGSLGAETGHWTYVYNDANQLVTTDKRPSATGPVSNKTNYLYDARGNRVKRDAGQDVAIAATASNQGISYTAVEAGTPGNTLGVGLENGAPGLAQAGVSVAGRQVNVTLAMDEGVKASALAQGVTYTAKSVGAGGNDLSVKILKAGAGQPASASVNGDEVTLNLETDAGTPHSLADQGITYTSKKAPGDGPELGVALVASEPDQEAEVLVVDGEVAVKLATDSGDRASATVQELTYQAATPGRAGNDLKVRYQLANENEDLSAAMVGDELQVSLEQTGSLAAQAEQPGLTYTATNPGTAGNDITVNQTLGGEGEPLSLSVSDRQVTVHLPRSGGHASAQWEGLTFTAAQPGTDGNSIAITFREAQSYGEPLGVWVEGSTVVVNLPAPYDENTPPSYSSVAQIASAIAASASSLVTVSGDVNNSNTIVYPPSPVQLTDGGNYTTTATVGDLAQAWTTTSGGLAAQALIQLLVSDPDESLQLTGWQLAGGDTGTVLSTTAEVASLFAGGVAGGQLTVSGSGDAETLAELGVRPLTGGGENSHSISQVHELVSLLNATPAVTEMMTVTGSGSTEVEAVGFQPLTGGTPRASISDVDALVDLVNETPAVAAKMTASGSGGSVVEEAGSLALTGGRLPQSISSVNEIVGLLNSTPAVTALMTVTGSGTAVVASVSGSMALSGGRVEYHASEVTQYAWDVPGRLASVTLPDGQQHRYDYDYRTRRIGTHQTASGASAAKHTAIVFSGGLSLAEYESSTSQTAIGAPSMSTVRYVRGPDMGGGVGGLLNSVRSGERKYNLSNGRGDIVAQSNANAALTWTASYEAYGKRTKETGSNTDKQRANSKDEDPTGLLNEGFRYRDIETGAWLSRDPAGFVDGPNLYAYVKQNPWTSFDPLGLQVKVTTNDHKTNEQGNTYSHTKIEMNVVIVDGSKGRTRLDGKTRTVQQTKRTREELEKIGADYKNAIEKLWTRDVKNDKGEVIRGVETHVTVAVVTSAKELAEHNDAHIMMIVDDVPDGNVKNMIARVDRVGGKVTAIENKHIEEYEKSTSSSQKGSFYITSAHEAGHNFGLFHPYGKGEGKSEDNPLNLDLPNNIMGYDSRTEIHPLQIDAIQNNYDMGFVNREHSGLAPWGPSNIPRYNLPRP